jgi:hypothetical protein
MCGRFLNKLPAAEIARMFGTKNALPNYPARFNIAQPIRCLSCASIRRPMSARSTHCGGASCRVGPKTLNSARVASMPARRRCRPLSIDDVALPRCNLALDHHRRVACGLIMASMAAAKLSSARL